MDTVIFLVFAIQRATSAKKDCNNHMDVTSGFQPLSSTCLCLVSSWRRCHGGTCLPVAHVLSRVDFHSLRPVRYIDCEMTTLPIARSQRQPPEVALFLWGPARHLVAGGLCWATSHNGKDDTLFSLE